MVQTIKVVLMEEKQLVVNMSINLKQNDQKEQAQLVAADAYRAGLKAKQRFHLRNHVHYGHQVNLGHHHANSTRVNQRHLLRSPIVEQPADLLEQIVQNKSKLIEMHAF